MSPYSVIWKGAWSLLSNLRIFASNLVSRVRRPVVELRWKCSRVYTLLERWCARDNGACEAFLACAWADELFGSSSNARALPTVTVITSVRWLCVSSILSAATSADSTIHHWKFLTNASTRSLLLHLHRTKCICTAWSALLLCQGEKCSMHGRHRKCTKCIFKNISILSKWVENMTYGNE